jgi:stage II sporulation protein AA (anti-sigma F factor antagonist)
MVAVTDASEYFSVEVVETGDEPVVVVRGEIDLRSAEPFWHAIDAVLAGSPRRLVVHLGETTFMDSSGLQVLLRAHTALGRLPEATVLRAPAAGVRRVLELAGIADLFAYDGDDDGPDGSGGSGGSGGFDGS